MIEYLLGGAHCIRVASSNLCGHSQGIFYRRSSPDSPPFVEEGTKIASGSVLGLVEVMKCFNQITYGGPGFPEKVEVAKILVQDSTEVQFGQPLFWVRPLT